MSQKTIYDIRRENLTRLLTERGAKRALAIKLDVTPSRVSHLVSPDSPGAGDSAKLIHEDTARQIESVLGLASNALDIDSAKPAIAPVRASPRAEPIDEQLLEDSVRAVIAAATETHSKIIADKAAQVVRMVYANARPTGHVDSAFVQQLVKLMR